MFTRAELELIVNLAIENDLFIITDEIYEFMLYGSEPHHLIPVAFPQAADRTFVRPPERDAP